MSQELPEQEVQFDVTPTGTIEEQDNTQRVDGKEVQVIHDRESDC